MQRHVLYFRMSEAKWLITVHSLESAYGNGTKPCGQNFAKTKSFLDKWMKEEEEG